MSRRGGIGLLTVSVVIWAVAVCGGILALACYSNTAGQQPQLAQSEDAEQAHYRLLMFVHPQCPCTRASLQQLTHIMAGAGSQVAVEVYIYEPTELPSDWPSDWQSDWQSDGLLGMVNRIPHTQAITDQDAAVARSYSAATSGQTLLYDAKGNLLFSGGITAGRGHEGDNRGQEALVGLIAGQPTAALPAQTPVFGCPIYVTQP